MSRRRAGKKIKNDLIFLGARFLFWLGRAVPLSAGMAFGRFAGRAAWRVVRGDRRRALAHLSIAFPGSDPAWRDAVGRRSFENLGQSLFELFHLDEILSPAGKYAGYVEVEGDEYIRETLARGQGAIAVTGHIGNWELFAAALAAHGIALRPVVRRLYDERIDTLLNDHRRKYGYSTFFRDDDDVGQGILDVLRQNLVPTILIDQDTRVRGAWVPFLGVPAHTPTGAAFLALHHGIDIHTGTIHRRPDGGHTIVLSPPFSRPDTGDVAADVTALTAALSDRLSDAIRAHPDEWVWMHRRWKKRPPGEPAWLNPERRAHVPGRRERFGHAIASALAARGLFGAGTAARIARLARLATPRRRAAVRRNLVELMGHRLGRFEVTGIEREVFASAGRTLGELVEAAYASEAELARRVAFRGAGPIVDALQKERGATLYVARWGAWPLAIAALSRTGVPVEMADEFDGAPRAAWIRRLLEKHGVAFATPSSNGESAGAAAPSAATDNRFARRTAHVRFLDEAIAGVVRGGDAEPDSPDPQSSILDLHRTDTPRFLLVAERARHGHVEVGVEPIDDGGHAFARAVSRWRRIVREKPGAWEGWLAFERRLP
ncbi:hypothetical protein K8I61_13710 [bacterium]|nr:hypothetical protein [bacterium]